MEELAGWEFVKEAVEAVQYSSNLSGLKEKGGENRQREGTYVGRREKK